MNPESGPVSVGLRRLISTLAGQELWSCGNRILDVAGGTKRGYMSNAVFTFIDANHHTEDWTTMLPGDKQARVHLDLRRTK